MRGLARILLGSTRRASELRARGPRPRFLSFATGGHRCSRRVRCPQRAAAGPEPVRLAARHGGPGQRWSSIPAAGRCLRHPVQRGRWRKQFLARQPEPKPAEHTPVSSSSGGWQRFGARQARAIATARTQAAARVPMRHPIAGRLTARRAPAEAVAAHPAADAARPVPALRWGRGGHSRP